ncbi:hypothetical protein BDN70DRAFT_909070 [Pholiota conissans]|uniref:Uncharacterized protein n=1 Tax=Pholiota conissans TaxID=109636 RepID=A0A9P6CNC6_9AGAR|nr:hypothetical protein BDN70DRAFT_909070 [Pholiota conissans]
MKHSADQPLPQDALCALSGAHGKPLRGRNLVVTFAHQAPLDQYSGGTGASGGAYRTRKTMMDVGRPTTLSMIKTGMSSRHEGKTQDKIAMMEAKLRQMERTNPRPALSDPSSTQSQSSFSQNNLSAATNQTPQLPTHSSLPAKPPPQIPGAQPPRAVKSAKLVGVKIKPKDKDKDKDKEKV